jgi:hypothetical protein
MTQRVLGNELCDCLEYSNKLLEELYITNCY